MKFGKTIETSAKELPEEWQPYIIQYKLLKKNIKQIVEELDSTFRTLNLSLPDNTGDDSENDAIDVQTTHSFETESGGSVDSERAALKDAKVIPEGIEYNIEKLPAVSKFISDSEAVLPLDSTQGSTDSESTSFDGKELSENESFPIPTPAFIGEATFDGECTSPDKGDGLTASASEAKDNNIRVVTKVVEDTEETQVTVRLETDQKFFDQLLNYIDRMRNFEKKYTKQYTTNVVSLGSDLTTVTSPFKHDFEIWREIFRLYIDANVWDHSEGDFRSAHSPKEGQNRFTKFTHHIEDIGLTKRFRDPHSARILMSFYKLNIELSYLRLLQEMNEVATRKIIKKHDKRTHLIAKTQFPQVVKIDASSLTRVLIYTVYNDLVGVVPQIDDYLCPMCLNISWRPLRLECGHVFCSRCVVKASRRRIFDCPMCRSKKAIYNASVANIDNALLNFLKLYFPKEIKEKQRDIQREISEEEAAAIVLAHSSTTDSGFLSVRQHGRFWPQLAETSATRGISTSTRLCGRPRQFEDHLRYPRARSKLPPRPETLSTTKLIKATNKMADDGADVLEQVKLTDEEVNKIFDSIMSADKRKVRDDQSLRHRTRAEYLKMIKESKEKKHQRESKEGSKPGAKQDTVESTKESTSNIRPVSEEAMEKLIYMDTRIAREMEEAKLAVFASTDTYSVTELENKIKTASALLPSAKPETSLQHSEDVDIDNADDDLVPELKAADFNNVIFANTIAGRTAEAVQAYRLMGEANVKPNQMTFANLTMTYAKAGDLESAVQMFKKLEEEGLEPTIYSYGTLIQAYKEFSRIDDAFRVYEAMKKREMWPNIPVYNSLIVACLKVGDLKRAWGVFEHLRYTIPEPNTISFSIMIHACAKNGEVEKAINLFEEMVSNRLALSDVTFNSLIHACAMRPDYFDECFRLLHMMEAHGFQPDFYTYNTIIYACARKKNLGLARDIFKDMLKKSMDPEYQGLVKVNAFTIANMMWVYGGSMKSVKSCSWRQVKGHESLAMEALAAANSRLDEGSFAAGLNHMQTKTEDQFRSVAISSKLIDIQARSVEAISSTDEAISSGEDKASIKDSYLNLVDMLLPEAVPETQKSVGSEATRLMYFYLDYLKGDVTSHLLNAYLSAAINNGRYYDAWYVYLGAFRRYNVARDGWSFQRIIRLCARTRDVPSAWRVWDEYKAWRLDVELALKTPGCDKLKASKTRLYVRDNDSHVSDPNQPSSPNTATQGMLDLAESLVFPGMLAMPERVAGGALATLPVDREIARKGIGCDMVTEHAVYMEMVNLLGSNQDFDSAIRLVREEKKGILEHAHSPTFEDVMSTYQNALMAGKKAAALDIRGLCMPKRTHQAHRALSRKWGTSFSWDRTDSQQKALSRRFPEEFRRHDGPFKDGEYVRLEKQK
ncbi:hypothetical protein EV175_001480 [Coemansia sp. RSA 1933]|nr:hypothetical protein EV175_001480 [Coemansia sp. RSA 1933]